MTGSKLCDSTPNPDNSNSYNIGISENIYSCDSSLTKTISSDFGKCTYYGENPYGGDYKHLYIQVDGNNQTYIYRDPNCNATWLHDPQQLSFHTHKCIDQEPPTGIFGAQCFKSFVPPPPSPPPSPSPCPSPYPSPCPSPSPSGPGPSPGLGPSPSPSPGQLPPPPPPPPPPTHESGSLSWGIILLLCIVGVLIFIGIAYVIHGQIYKKLKKSETRTPSSPTPKKDK